MKIAYETIFALTGENTYTTEIPSLQGCISQGTGIDHSTEMIIEAASLWLLDELEEGNPIPKARKTTKEDLSIFKDPIVRTIEIDIEQFAKKHAKQTTTRAIEIPTWLNTLADQAHINLPDTVQTAIMQSVR